MFFRACRPPFSAPAGILAALALGACTPQTPNQDPAIDALIADFGAAELQRQPEEADLLGVPEKVFGRPYGALTDDRSMAATERLFATRLEFLTKFDRLDRTTFSPDRARTYEALRAVLEATVAVDAYGYGRSTLGWASPYVITFADGAYNDMVKLLTLDEPISTRAQADAWLQRLGHMSTAMRDERRRFEVDIDAGAIPPKAVLQRTLAKVRLLAPALDPRQHVLVQHLTEALAQIADISEADIEGLSKKASTLVGGDIRKEYTALISLLEKTMAKAPEEPGVWKLPDGANYYADVLRLQTTTAMTPAQLNDMGKKLVEQLTAQLDPLLADAGIAEGSVGARLRALAMQPDLQHPDTPEGRLALLDSVNARIKWATGAYGRVIALDKLSPAVLRETPRISQDTASKAYYRPAPLGGGRPGVYNITLRSTADFPMWTLPSLTFHEAIPGHHLQVEAGRRRPEIPVISHLISTAAFSEGWATYAEDLAAELGAYESDPLGKIGYLQSMLLRAARLVTDTGIHSGKWSRQQAVDYLVETAGLAQAQAELEVDRYSIRPGLACAYMTGRETIRRLRATAQKELGARFDIKAFHTAILAPGPRPLPVVEADVGHWIDTLRPPPPSPEE